MTVLWIVLYLFGGGTDYKPLGTFESVEACYSVIPAAQEEAKKRYNIGYTLDRGDNDVRDVAFKCLPPSWQPPVVVVVPPPVNRWIIIK